MKRRLAYLLPIIGLGFASAVFAAAPQVRNVKVYSDAGNTEITDNQTAPNNSSDVYISYEVRDTDNDVLTATMEYSVDGGTTFRQASTFVGTPAVGNIGSPTSYTEKWIRWNAEADVPGVLSAASIIKISVTDVRLPIDPTTDPNNVVNDSSLRVVTGRTYGMGDWSGSDADAPRHDVSVSTFYMKATEVTQSEWMSIYNQHNDVFNIADNGIGTSDSKPARLLSWYDAIVWLNARTYEYNLDHNPDLSYAYLKPGESGPTTDPSKAWGYIDSQDPDGARDGVPVYDPDATGYRMPTEAEWELAARGLSEGRDYPNGDSFTAFTGNANGINTTVVDVASASFPPNDFGLYDMIGNVSEFCFDLYSLNYYDTDAEIEVNPVNTTTGTTRVLRGGNYATNAADARVSSRSEGNPLTLESNAAGLRFARQAQYED